MKVTMVLGLLWSRLTNIRYRLDLVIVNLLPVLSLVSIHVPHEGSDVSPPRVWGHLRLLMGSLVVRSVHPHGCGDISYYEAHTGYYARFTPTGVGTSV